MRLKVFKFERRIFTSKSGKTRVEKEDAQCEEERSRNLSFSKNYEELYPSNRLSIIRACEPLPGVRWFCFRFYCQVGEESEVADDSTFHQPKRSYLGHLFLVTFKIFCIAKTLNEKAAVRVFRYYVKNIFSNVLNSSNCAELILPSIAAYVCIENTSFCKILQSHSEVVNYVLKICNGIDDHVKWCSHSALHTAPRHKLVTTHGWFYLQNLKVDDFFIGSVSMNCSPKLSTHS